MLIQEMDHISNHHNRKLLLLEFLYVFRFDLIEYFDLIYLED